MIIYILGFLCCLSALIFFIAKYKESDSLEEEFVWKDSEQKDSLQSDTVPENSPEQNVSPNLLDEMKEEANAVQQVQRLFAKADALPAREIFDLKDKVKDFSYNLEENRLLEEKHYNELKNLAQNLEKRLASFENEYLNNLHPTLTTLIKELETLQNKDKNI
ncbi:MAG: hypothetical protein K6E94_03040 [Elusimicrobiaceae bacterium]|nr:hypothetical protein [Elusimicrobiaceae bacterium]